MNPWYSTDVAARLLNATDGGRLMFVWEAELNDGSVMRQFEDHTFEILRTNPNAAVPIDSSLRISTRDIPRDKVVLFRILPIALTQELAPWFSQSFEQKVDPIKEDLLAYFLIDKFVVGGPVGIPELARQVLGTLDRATGKKWIKVISPSGATKETEVEDQSYEGE